HQDKGVSWPTAEALHKKEPAYFGARDTRNKARRAALKEHKDVASCNGQPSTSAITRAAAAIVKLREARAELDALTHDGPLNVEIYAIGKLAEKLTKD